MRCVTRTAVLVCLLAGSAQGDDLPAAVVERPATLPARMVELTADAGFDHARVLGVVVQHDTGLTLGVRWGVRSRLELSLASPFVIAPDTRWSQEGLAQVTYRAWRGGNLELAPVATVPLSVHSGADVTSTIALGANLRWRTSERVLVIVGEHLLPIHIRPAAALDVGLDGRVVVQLTPRWAALAQLAVGERTIVGQIDRSVAPWHHLMASAGVVFATAARLDVLLDVHGDGLHPGDRIGVDLAIARRL